MTTAETLSAGLDGEAGHAELRDAEEHLEGCPDCRGRYRDAVAVSRAVRVMPAEQHPDFTARVLPAWRPRRRDRLRGPAGNRLRLLLRVLLAVIATVQSGIAVMQLTGLGASAYPAGVMMDMAHVDHETGAWNAAIAVALAWVAWRARHAGAHVPLLLSFGAALTGLCVLDLVLGNIGMARVAMHVPVLLGLALVMGLAVLHEPQGRPDAPSLGRPEVPERVGTRTPADPAVPDSGSAPPPAAYRDSA